MFFILPHAIFQADGTYAIAIQVHHVGGNNSDWYVGWNGSQFTLEAEEIF